MSLRQTHTISYSHNLTIFSLSFFSSPVSPSSVSLVQTLKGEKSAKCLRLDRCSSDTLRCDGSILHADKSGLLGVLLLAKVRSFHLYEKPIKLLELPRAQGVLSLAAKLKARVSKSSYQMPWTPPGAHPIARPTCWPLRVQGRKCIVALSKRRIRLGVGNTSMVCAPRKRCDQDRGHVRLTRKQRSCLQRV